MLFTSGEKAENVPECEASVTAFQPQPPGEHVGTADTKLPSVPLSKPSFTGVVVHAGVAVGVGVGVGVNVAVAVAVGVGVRVAVAVAVGLGEPIGDAVAVGVGVGDPPTTSSAPMSGVVGLRGLPS